MANDKLGFTFYPKDWWTSDTYFELDHFERYVFLECLFLMYSNNGHLTHSKTQIETRIRTEIKPKSWEKITQNFIRTDLGYSLLSVNKRLKKSVTNRANGLKGGRPPKPKKPKYETQNNPPLERERESEGESEIYINNNAFVSECLQADQWCDTVCMQHNILPDKLEEVLNDFVAHLITTQEQKKDLKDFKTHFTNWIKKQPIIQHPASLSTGTNQRQPYYHDD